MVEVEMMDLTEEELRPLCDQRIAREVTQNISYENIEVKGCIIGPSGAGKSSLINSLCGLSGKDAAKEGAMETTTECKPYTAAKGGYQIVDIPGVGTDAVPPETYAEKYELKKYDFIIVLLINPRLTHAAELNEWATKLAQQDLNKHIFLVYSLFDLFLQNHYNDLNQHDDDRMFLHDLSDEEQRKYIESAKNVLLSKFPAETLFVGRPLKQKSPRDTVHTFDFTTLVKNILNSLNARKRDVVIQNFTAFSSDWVDSKKESLKHLMLGLSIGSAASGAIPVPGPGAAIDIGIIIGFGAKCRKVFCLEDSDIKKNFSPEIAKIFIPRVAAVIATIGVSIAVTSLDDAIKLVPVIGTVIGSIVGVVISGPLMLATLYRVRNMFADLVVEMMHAEARAQANQHFGVSDRN